MVCGHTKSTALIKNVVGKVRKVELVNMLTQTKFLNIFDVSTDLTKAIF